MSLYDENAYEQCLNEEKKLEDEKRKAERIKRMRGWLGVKGAVTGGGHPDDNGPLLYGDGHSGWNR